MANRLLIITLVLVVSTPALAQSPRTSQTTSPTTPRGRLIAESRQLHLVRMELDRAFYTSDEYLSARNQLIQARAALEAARSAIRESLRRTPEYNRLLSTLLAAEQRLAAAREKPDASPRTLTPLAIEVLEHRQAISRFESEAFEADPNIPALRDDLVLAHYQLQERILEHRQSIPMNREWFAARQRVEQARAALRPPTRPRPSESESPLLLANIN
jgi:DNA polymerase III delta prime subunit